MYEQRIIEIRVEKIVSKQVLLTIFKIILQACYKEIGISEYVIEETFYIVH